MAYYQDRRTGVGELLNGTFRELAVIRREIGIYLVAFIVAGLLADFISPFRPVSAFATFCGYWVGQYWLYRVALERAGIMVDEKFKVFSLFFMALILVFPIYIGMAFLVIPGVLLASKWIMAPTYLVAEKVDLFQAMSGSWRASENNMWAIAGAFTILCILWFVAAAVLGAVGAGYEEVIESAGFSIGSDDSNVFGWIGVHILPLLLLGLSISAYKALGDDETSIAAVFE